MKEKLGLDATDCFRERRILKNLDRKWDNSSKLPRLRDFYCVTKTEKKSTFCDIFMLLHNENLLKLI